MSLEKCRLKIKEKLNNLNLKVYDLDRELTETGIYLFYDSFYYNESYVLFRKFYIYVAGFLYDKILNFYSTLESVEKAFTYFDTSVDCIKIIKGETVEFQPTGFVIFKFDIEVADIYE